MKKLEIIMKPEKLDELRAILDANGAKGLSIFNIMGCGNQKGIVKKYHGVEYKVDLLPKVKVETVVDEEVANKLIDILVAAFNTDSIGGGKIFVSQVEDAIRLRTGERGSDAL